MRTQDQTMSQRKRRASLLLLDKNISPIFLVLQLSCIQWSFSFLDIRNGSVYTFSLVHVNLLSIWAHGTQFLFTLRPQSGEKNTRVFLCLLRQTEAKGQQRQFRKSAVGMGTEPRGLESFCDSTGRGTTPVGSLVGLRRLELPGCWNSLQPLRG